MKIKLLILILLSILLAFKVRAADNVLNIYAWAGEIPDRIIHQFEDETGIKVNLSTYENNEVLYAKLRATKTPGYDLIIPSSYFVDRMRKQDMLLPLDKNKIAHFKNLNPEFLHPAYDPNLENSVPYLWGVTGIFYNDHYYQANQLKKWSDLWDARFNNQLMLLDDIRENFSIALLALGYSANDQDPEHIKQAFFKLKALMKNVKVFSSETVVSIVIDEDAVAGTAWNGDVYKASTENSNIQFVFPQEGFVIWVDNLAIPKTAPHVENAYRFINFVLQASIGKEISLATSFPTTNLAAQKLLPPAIQNNPMFYPPRDVMRRGQFQVDLGETVLQTYEKYWEMLKMGV